MKRRILGIVVPVLAGLTIVGTGFSVWYFTSDATETSFDTQVNLAGYAEIGNLQIKDRASHYRLFLDSTRDGGIALQSSADGAAWTDTNTIDLTYELSVQDATYTDLNDKNPQITMEFTVPAALETYVSITLNSGALTPGTATDTITYTYTGQLDFPNPVASGTYDIEMPTFVFAWQDGQEPNSSATYAAAQAALASGEISITYTLAWVNA